MKLFSFLLLLTLVPLGHAQSYSEIFKAVAVDRAEEDRMGYAVDICGNYAIVGAYADDFGGSNPNMGSAYIFEKTGYDDWSFVQKINNSDQDDYDRFGWSVAINGDYAVIGSYAEDHDAADANALSSAGSAYVFHRNESGIWIEQTKLVASDRQAEDEFGWSVDIYGTTIVVGAHHEGHNVSGGAYEFHAGSIYVFDLDEGAGIWTESQKIVPSDRADDHIYPNGRPDPTDEDVSDLFGGSVAIWGDYIIAGAHMHDYGLGGVGTGFRWNQGAAYIFERSGGVWTENQKIQANIQAAWDRFGWAVDLDSNIAVIGVPTEDESEFEGASLMNAGGAYIFERDVDGDWNQIQKLDASDRTTGDHFGTAVAIDGNYLVIGAEQEDIGAELTDPDLSNAGAAYIFYKDEDGEWEEIQKIDASDRSEDDLYGQAVGLSEHSVIVGAWQQDFDAVGGDELEDAGAAYIYSSLLCSPSSYSSDITICYDETYSVADNVYNLSGTYIDSMRSINACDSIIITNLTVIEPVLFAQSISICSGTAIEVGIHSYDTSGEYYDTLTAITGCDSIITTDLIVNPIISFTQDIYRCFGETFSVSDSIYSENGSYENILETVAGCDSIVYTNLFIEEENIRSQDFILCAGNSVAVGESVYDITGTYYDTLSSYTACDSIIITSLYLLPAIDVTVITEFNILTAGDPGILSTTFQWFDCDLGLPLAGATNRVFTAPYNGHFAVKITDGECSETSDCYTVEGLGVDEYNPYHIALFPNPNNGQFTIRLDDFEGEDLPLQITNSLGEIVYNGNISQVNTSINLSIAEGIYFVRIWKDGVPSIQKIIIQ